MISFAIFYLIGWLLGEVALLAVWAMRQHRLVKPADYFVSQWPMVLLSSAVALACCISWAEGTLAKLVIDKFGLDLPDTLGVSVLVGVAVTLFAHPILKLVGKRLGLVEAEVLPEPESTSQKGD